MFPLKKKLTSCADMGTGSEIFAFYILAFAKSFFLSFVLMISFHFFILTNNVFTVINYFKLNP